MKHQPLPDYAAWLQAQIDAGDEQLAAEIAEQYLTGRSYANPGWVPDAEYTERWNKRWVAYRASCDGPNYNPFGYVDNSVGKVAK